jgi:hypothetical protein
MQDPTAVSMKVLMKDMRQRMYKSSEYRRRQQRQQTPLFGTRTPAQTIPPRPPGMPLACADLYSDFGLPWDL